MKRIIAMGDMHCGHRVGLTPPAFNGKHDGKWSEIRKALWGHYTKLLKQLEPIDGVLFMGDAVDGKSKRWGGTDILEPSVLRQADMAVECFNQVRLHARRGFKIYGVYGTAYHTAIDGEDAEDIVARNAGFEHIGAHEWIDIEGNIFDLKHAVGSSSIPHGRATPLLREKMWSAMWSDDLDGHPQPNVILRGHVHYHTFVGDAGCLAMTLPALQGWGSKFGARLCSGLVHWGLVHFDVSKRGFEWHSHIVDIEEQKPKTRRM